MKRVHPIAILLLICGLGLPAFADSPFQTALSTKSDDVEWGCVQILNKLQYPNVYPLLDKRKGKLKWNDVDVIADQLIIASREKDSHGHSTLAAKRAQSDLFKLVSGLAFNQIHSRLENVHDSLDALSQLNLNLSKAFSDRFRTDGTGKFSAYVIRAARRMANQHQAERSRRRPEVLVADPTIEQRHVKHPAKLSDSDRQETRSVFNTIFDSLPEREREYLGLAWFGKLSQVEIAERFSISRAAVHKIKKRAREKIALGLATNPRMREIYPWMEAYAKGTAKIGARFRGKSTLVQP